MRGWFVALPLIAACYAPTTPAGAPCTTSNECPGEQQCVAEVCTLMPGSVPADGGGSAGDAPSASIDRDNDGLTNDQDNCPDVANAGQGNEDGDRFGDVCDPCPPIPDDAPADPDGDGVAGVCDPNPSKPGDRIELFEGFHQGLPAWMRSAGWSAVGDAVRLTAAAGVREYVLPVPAKPLPNASHVTLAASVVVEQVVGGADADHEIGLATPYDVSKDSGIECAMYQPASMSGPRRVALYDDFQVTELGSSAHVWKDNTEYRMSLVRSGSSYLCNVSGATGSSVISRPSSSAAAQSALTVRASAMNARVNWVLIVSSP